MTFQVRVYRQAQDEADAIFHWLAERSPEGAARWYERYLTTLRGLEQCADGLSEAPESEHLGSSLRQAFFKTRRGRTYRVLFVLQAEVVHVVGVRAPGQDMVRPGDIKLLPE